MTTSTAETGPRPTDLILTLHIQYKVYKPAQFDELTNFFTDKQNVNIFWEGMQVLDVPDLPKPSPNPDQLTPLTRSKTDSINRLCESVFSNENLEIYLQNPGCFQSFFIYFKSLLESIGLSLRPLRKIFFSETFYELFLDNQEYEIDILEPVFNALLSLFQNLSPSEVKDIFDVILHHRNPKIFFTKSFLSLLPLLPGKISCRKVATIAETIWDIISLSKNLEILFSEDFSESIPPLLDIIPTDQVVTICKNIFTKENSRWFRVILASKWEVLFTKKKFSTRQQFEIFHLLESTHFFLLSQYLFKKNDFPFPPANSKQSYPIAAKIVIWYYCDSCFPTNSTKLKTAFIVEQMKKHFSDNEKEKKSLWEEYYIFLLNSQGSLDITKLDTNFEALKDYSSVSGNIPSPLLPNNSVATKILDLFGSSPQVEEPEQANFFLILISVFVGKLHVSSFERLKGALLAKHPTNTPALKNWCFNPKCIIAAKKLVPEPLQTELRDRYSDLSSDNHDLFSIPPGKDNTLYARLLFAVDQFLASQRDILNRFYLSSWQGEEPEVLDPEIYINLPNGTFGFSGILDPYPQLESVLNKTLLWPIDYSSNSIPPDIPEVSNASNNNTQSDTEELSTTIQNTDQLNNSSQQSTDSTPPPMQIPLESFRKTIREIIENARKPSQSFINQHLTDKNFEFNHFSEFFLHSRILSCGFPLWLSPNSCGKPLSEIMFVLGASEDNFVLNNLISTKVDRAVYFYILDDEGNPILVTVSADEFKKFLNLRKYHEDTISVTYSSGPGLLLTLRTLLPLCYEKLDQQTPSDQQEAFLPSNFINLLKVLRTFGCVQGPNGVEFYTFSFRFPDVTDNSQFEEFALKLRNSTDFSIKKVMEFFSTNPSFAINISFSRFSGVPGQSPNELNALSTNELIALSTTKTRAAELKHYIKYNTEINVYLYSCLEPLLRAAKSITSIKLDPITVKVLIQQGSKSSISFNRETYELIRNFQTGQSGLLGQSLDPSFTPPSKTTVEPNTPLEESNSNATKQPELREPLHNGYKSTHEFAMPNLQIFDLKCLYQNYSMGTRIHVAQINPPDLQRKHISPTKNTGENQIISTSSSPFIVKEYFHIDPHPETPIQDIYRLFSTHTSFDADQSSTDYHICQSIDSGFFNVTPDILRDSEAMTHLTPFMGYSIDKLYKSRNLFVVLPKRIGNPVCLLHGFTSVYCSTSTHVDDTENSLCCFTEGDLSLDFSNRTHEPKPGSCRCKCCFDNKIGTGNKMDKGPFCGSLFSYTKMIIDTHLAILEFLSGSSAMTGQTQMTQRISFTDCKESNFVFNPESRCFEAIDYGQSVMFTDDNSTIKSHTYSYTQTVPFQNWFSNSFQHFHASIRKHLKTKVENTDPLNYDLVFKAQTLLDYLNSDDIELGLLSINSLQTARDFVAMVSKISSFLTNCG